MTSPAPRGCCGISTPVGHEHMERLLQETEARCGFITSFGSHADSVQRPSVFTIGESIRTNPRNRTTIPTGFAPPVDANVISANGPLPGVCTVGPVIIICRPIGAEALAPDGWARVRHAASRMRALKLGTNELLRRCLQRHQERCNDGCQCRCLKSIHVRHVPFASCFWLRSICCAVDRRRKPAIGRVRNATDARVSAG